MCTVRKMSTLGRFSGRMSATVRKMCTLGRFRDSIVVPRWWQHLRDGNWWARHYPQVWVWRISTGGASSAGASISGRKGKFYNRGKGRRDACNKSSGKCGGKRGFARVPPPPPDALVQSFAAGRSFAAMKRLAIGASPPVGPPASGRPASGRPASASDAGTSGCRSWPAGQPVRLWPAGPPGPDPPPRVVPPRRPVHLPRPVPVPPPRPVPQPRVVPPRRPVPPPPLRPVEPPLRPPPPQRIMLYKPSEWLPGWWREVAFVSQEAQRSLAFAAPELGYRTELQIMALSTASPEREITEDDEAHVTEDDEAHAPTLGGREARRPFRSPSPRRRIPKQPSVPPPGLRLKRRRSSSPDVAGPSSAASSAAAAPTDVGTSAPTAPPMLAPAAPTMAPTTATATAPAPFRFIPCANEKCEYIADPAVDPSGQFCCVTCRKWHVAGWKRSGKAHGEWCNSWKQTDWIESMRESVPTVAETEYDHAD